MPEQATWLQMGSFGLIAAGFFWLIFKGIPAFLSALVSLTETFKTEMAQERAKCEARDEKFLEALRETHASQTAAMQTLSASVDTTSKLITVHHEMAVKAVEKLEPK